MYTVGKRSIMPFFFGSIEENMGSSIQKDEIFNIAAIRSIRGFYL